MTLEENTKAKETKDTSKDTPDFALWTAFFWKLIKSLAIIVAGTTVMYFICRSLIY